MTRLLSIAGISFVSVVPFLMIFHRLLELDDDIAGYLSFFFAWLVTPIVLGRIWKGPPDLEVLPVDPNDPLMRRQITRAKSEFPRFLKGLEEGKLEAYIKFPYTFGSEIEHLWGSAHKVDGDCIIASLESAPVGETPEEMYERLSIKIEDIEDWMLVNAKGTTYGGYTMLAMAQIYQRDHGKLPKPYAQDLEHFADFSWPEKA